MPETHESTDGGAIIVGRYRVEAELGRGGMARVCRVLDERSGQRLALKQLVAPGQSNETIQVMFAREYHTLVQLAHPRIVRVFDYGLNGELPYYTMELLDGCDARELLRSRPLGVREICTLLRDAASALALIHSRRMVHRDVSARNLWRMPDGRAKLIDFGTLVAMGPQTRVAGTAPFVPPEAVYMQSLDARCDLFGLGALAYYLLTKRNAYPARDITELRQIWQHRPRSPDALRPEIPRALADLVMSLLSLDLRGRPSSAAEVFDRLTAIADLPVDDDRHLAQAFLTSPKLVARDAIGVQLGKRLQRARRNHGGTVSLVAPAGFGRSRMLASFVLEAKLMGAAVISLNATAVESASLSLARMIAERLVELLPMTAAAAVDHAGVLGHLSPVLHRALGEPALAELKSHEATRKLRSAVLALIALASRTHNLVIAVDDVHRADEASLGVLAQLGTLAQPHRLLLVTTCDEAALASAPPVLGQIVAPANRIALGPIDMDHARELLGSLFGDVPGLDQAVRWLHELSQGSPQICMQYAQYLVDQGVARYEGGQWRLPSDLRQLALPRTLGAMLDGRVAALSDDARALALSLALAHDNSRASWQPEYHVRVADFPALLGIDPAAAATSDELAIAAPGRAYAALDELLRTGVIEQRDTYYLLGQRAMIDALLRAADEDTRKRTHVRLAEIFGQSAYGWGRTLAVVQLQRAGEHERARALLSRMTAQHATGTLDWRDVRLSVSAAFYKAAIEHWQAHGGPVREGILLRRMLVLIAAVHDWSLAQHGEPQLLQLRSDCGLLHWDDTDPAQPPQQRVLECMKRAQQAHELKAEHERGLAPADAVRELAACAIPLQAAFANSYDIAALGMLPSVLEPLRSLSPLMTLLADLVELSRDRTLGRELGDRILRTGVERMFAATELSGTLRQGGAAVNMYAQTLMDARVGRRDRGLQAMDFLAAATGEEFFLVAHGRWLLYAFGGQSAQARPARKRAEGVTEDDAWRRKAVLYLEAELHALTGDLLSLQQTADAMIELAGKFEGWRPWLSWARAHVHRLRGELELAETELERALGLARAGEHRAWVRAAPSYAELRLERGDPEGALRQAEQILKTIEELALERTAIVAIERVRALAESSRGRHDVACAALERAFTEARALEYGGLPLATLYEAQARVALAAGRAQECAEALLQLHELLAHADAPALINAYEALRAESKQLQIPQLSVAERQRGDDGNDVDDELTTQVRTRLAAIGDRQQRALEALQLLLDDTGAASGHLFLFDAGGLFVAASSGSVQAGETLLACAQDHVANELRGASFDAVTVLENAASRMPGPTGQGPSPLTPVLVTDGGDANTLLGLALLGAREAPVRPPRAQLVRAISRCLQAAGDSVPLAMDA